VYSLPDVVQMLVPTVDTVRFSYLLEACLDVQRSVLFTGVTGVGKSVISAAALETLASAPQPAGVADSACSSRIAGRLLAHTVVFSAQTSSIDTQLLIESKLEKKRKTRYVVCQTIGPVWMGVCCIHLSLQTGSMSTATSSCICALLLHCV
jgi:hypothetical protein